MNALHIYNVTHKDVKTGRMAVTSIRAFDLYDARKKFEEAHGSGRLARKEILSIERVKGK